MAPKTAKKAVVLLSGGLDSTTVLAHAIDAGWEAHALSFDYGQRHRLELARAAEIASALGAASHRTIRVDLGSFGGSALTSEIPVPKGAPGESIGTGIPVTYVPARNTVFLSLALGLAETLDARDLFLGVNALDYSGYPDCRPPFLEAFEQLADLATKAGVETEGPAFRVHAPLLEMSKGDIVRRAAELGVDLSRTTSCYDPGPAGRPCGACDACRLRAKGFREAGVDDPAIAAPDPIGDAAPSIVVNEIFRSIQGESTRAGRPCTFVRLTGCDLRCRWCDTEYAFHEGTKRSVADVVAEVAAAGPELVCVTGGEPLLQKGVHALITALLDAGRSVSIETGGHRDISGVDPRAQLVIDLKAPSSGEVDRNRWENLARLREGDEVKIVIADRTDFDWALAAIRTHGLEGRHPVLLSPVHRSLEPATLAEWMLEAGLEARVQLQLHKLLWPEAVRGV